MVNFNPYQNVNPPHPDSPPPSRILRTPTTPPPLVRRNQQRQHERIEHNIHILNNLRQYSQIMQNRLNKESLTSGEDVPIR